MKYSLIRPDGSIIRTMEFDTPPTPIPAIKGKWLPDNPPSYNPQLQEMARNPTQSVNNTEIVYTISPRSISIIRSEKLAQLEASRDAAEHANVTIAGKTYSGSETFQANVSRMINQVGRGKPIAGAADTWRTANAQPVVMTAALLGLIEDAIMVQGAAARTRFWQKFDAVNAPSATVEIINAVTW